MAGAREDGGCCCTQGWLSPGLSPGLAAAGWHRCVSAERAVEQRCQEAGGRARARFAAVEAAWDTSGDQAQPARGSRAALHGSAQAALCL